MPALGYRCGAILPSATRMSSVNSDRPEEAGAEVVLWPHLAQPSFQPPPGLLSHASENEELESAFPRAFHLGYWLWLGSCQSWTFGRNLNVELWVRQVKKQAACGGPWPRPWQCASASGKFIMWRLPTGVGRLSVSRQRECDSASRGLLGGAQPRACYSRLYTSLKTW